MHEGEEVKAGYRGEEEEVKAGCRRGEEAKAVCRGGRCSVVGLGTTGSRSVTRAR